MANVDNYAQSSSSNVNASNQEAIIDIKTNFYTREGLWAIVPALDYTKSTNFLVNTTNTQLNSNNQSTTTTAAATTTNFNNNTGGGGYMTNNLSNEPVKLQILTVNNLKCEKCNNRITVKQQNTNENVKSEYLCKYCNHTNNNSINSKSDNLMEIIIFNFSRELYCYYYNGIKQPSDVKNLLDRKTYKSICVTCHDVNIESYTKNSSNLPIVVGFNKGEIHVYDAFKKDSSQCFNSGKTIDKTKATCVKWLPNSLHLFLISYASGNMYLYDMSSQQNQSTSNQNPNYQLVYGGEGYSVYNNVVKNSKSNNNNNNNSSNGSHSDNNSNSFKLFNGGGNSVSMNGNDNNNENNSNSGAGSGSNSANPIMKWSITGNDVGNSTPGINEFSFSPCGQYLALACQDGYLRVFNYREMSLKSLMKSYFGGLLCLTWSSDGKYIATGGEDDLITVFSFFENRVACRGRGHSSWINSVQFDMWAQPYIDHNVFNNVKSNDNDDQDSDFEDYHNKKASKSNRRMSSAAANKRMSSISDYEQLFNTNKSAFYRLASVGQDNKIAFWDLTDDVLKEKIHSRSRVASIAHTNSINRDSDFRSSIQTDKQQPQHYHDDLNMNLNLGSSSANSSSASSSVGASGSSGLGFFKKHKRLTVVGNSNKNTLSNKSATLTNGSKTAATKSLEQKFSKLNLNQLCPKLDEVPMLEPLICKRISQERLTSLIFREESFLVACQDGIVSTWARPGKSVTVHKVSESNDKVSTFL